MAKIVLTEMRAAYSFGSLCSEFSHINDGWKSRWKMEMPGFLFRGADRCAYDLNPSLLRRPYPASNVDLAKLENSLWVEFSSTYFRATSASRDQAPPRATPYPPERMVPAPGAG